MRNGLLLGERRLDAPKGAARGVAQEGPFFRRGAGAVWWRGAGAWSALGPDGAVFRALFGACAQTECGLRWGLRGLARNRMHIGAEVLALLAP
jgi:hypothetical protein